MSFENVQRYFSSANLADRIIVPEKSSATVEEAANAIGCEPKQIAKTMSLFLEEKPILIVTAGDARIDNRKYKNTFHQKAKMIPAEQVEAVVGHAPGGVCPFAVNPDVAVFLDVSLKRFAFVYPAAGSGHSAVKLTIGELEEHSRYTEWVDVCKGWDDNGGRKLSD